jgi:hypothetical protein
LLPLPGRAVMGALQRPSPSPSARWAQQRESRAVRCSAIGVGVCVMAERIGDITMAREMVRYFGWRRAAELLGVCTIAALAGVDPDEEPPDFPTRTTWWTVRKDLKRFAGHLRALGYLLEGDEVTPEKIGTLKLQK